MNRPNDILLPANPYFIAFSLASAFFLHLLPYEKRIIVPDFIAIVLLFWNMHQPHKVGIGIAFMLGLLIDVHDASLLGEHALAYTLLSYSAIMMQRRVLCLSLGQQIFVVMPLLVVAQAVPFIIQLIAGSAFPGWGRLLDSLASALLWAPSSLLLQLPQKRAASLDDTRSI
ncbi:rod shape-determining protein MreD [Candidatus Vallotia cooleyia]|uniref:rod shape-determining protein MreD n=1 Tax=Candidatus Vallotiella adelgis TaxID=1177211 RepID=UPI001D006F81|nr:rod shape-determining protein MreD [Candidatus Vallotia cooleyia]UDG82597.1 rod shape-determining protein MreD [Candidatus Vallotia cooleyia]